MGRSPGCGREGMKRGPWTPEEDITLVTYIQEYGAGNWRAVPTDTGLRRCSKSCRLRWSNYLRPGIKRGSFSEKEEKLIIHLQALLGNRWATIASYLPERTDNDIKNYWNTHLSKKMKKVQSDGDGSTGCTDGLSSRNQPKAKDRWERRLQTDIHMAKRALCEALSPDSTPTFMSRLNQPSSSSNLCHSVCSQSQSHSRGQQPLLSPLATCAPSAENISLPLQGWTTNTQKPQDLPPISAARSSPQSTQRSWNTTGSDGGHSVCSDGDATSSSASGCILSSEALDTLLCFDLSRPEEAPGTAFFQVGSEQVPLSLLESWLFDEGVGQGQETLMGMPLHNTPGLF